MAEKPEQYLGDKDMSEKDNVFLNHPTGGEDYSTREQAEGTDVASLQLELSEQRRIGDAQQSPWDHNRVPVERTAK
jgi:hypothetical protein